MTARQIRGIQPISLEPSSALTGANASAITSTITVGCSKNREQPDNSHLSPDKYEVLDTYGPLRHSRRNPAFSDAA
jgi:hypothetical protein